MSQTNVEQPSGNSASQRAKDSRRTRIEAGGERIDVVISKSIEQDRQLIIESRSHLKMKTALIDTLIREEAERIRSKTK